MKLDKVRRMAVRILKTGSKNVWMDPEKFEDLKNCMTKEDVREQISKGSIKKKASFGQSTGRARKMKIKRKKGRKRGFGKRKGTLKARMQKKKSWVRAVRSQRKFLMALREKKKVSKKQYSKVYRLVKGGYFRGKRYIEQYLKEKND
jgi:large subunit ribosomal protein L19e